MNLDERKSRLKMFLEMESDKEMLKNVKTWHFKVNEAFQATGKALGVEKAGKLLLEHLPYIVEDVERRKRFRHILNMFQTFEAAATAMDGLTITEASNVVQEVLDSL